MVRLSGRLVDPIYVDGANWVALVYRQVIRSTIDLPRARKDNSHTGIHLAATLQDAELGGAIDLQIRQRGSHRIHVARLTGKVEQVVLPLQQISQAMGISDVGDVDPDTVPDPFDIEEGSAVVRDKAINQHDGGSHFDQTSR